MKYIFLVLFFVLEMFGAVLKSPVLSVNSENTEATVKLEKVDVGVNGFIVRNISDKRSTILTNAEVIAYDKNSQIATLKLSEFDSLSNSALPSGKWVPEVGDTAVLAFGYSRGMLIAPTEDIFYRVTKSSNIQWVHPDLFATLLSFNGHPTPQREDFTQMSIDNSVGLLYIFLDAKIFTLDAKSFKILTITDAKLEQGEANLPFYTRVPEIDANWFGAGSWRLDEYEPHYYELMVEANPKNVELYNIVKSGGEKLEDLIEEFEIKE